MTYRIKFAGWFIVFLILFLFLEFSSFILLKMGPFSDLQYVEPNVTEHQFSDYIEQRDPKLGWPTKAWINRNTEDFGARISPANRELIENPVCVSVYGDSFAYGDEVEDLHAWPNVLASNLGCRVLNFGVVGYGTDQALLRYESHLENDYVLGNNIILTIYPDNLNRNVNEWRYLLSGNKLGFKPVFKKIDSTYEVKPIINLDYKTYQELSQEPQNFFDVDFFVPGKGFLKSKSKITFPYSLSLLEVSWRLFSSINPNRIGAKWNFVNLPNWYDHRQGMASEKEAVLKFILERYSRVCERIEKDCIVVLFADPELFVMIAESGRHELDLIGDMITGDVVYIDLTYALSDIFGDRFCLFYTKPEACSGHFNEEANQIIAEILSKKLR